MWKKTNGRKTHKRTCDLAVFCTNRVLMLALEVCTPYTQSAHMEYLDLVTFGPWSVGSFKNHAVVVST